MRVYQGGDLPSVADLAETFTNMCEARLKLKLGKCISGITNEKVFSCFISIKGIKANPNKIRALTQMQPSKNRKDVQKITCRIASLNRFVSKLVERNLPFFTASRTGAASHPICLINAFSSQQSFGCRVERTKQNNKAAVVGVFHFGGPHRI
jgi:hypothetical protein